MLNGLSTSKTSKEVLQMLKNLNEKGQTIILITHDLEVAKEATRVVRIHDGQLFGANAEAADRTRPATTAKIVAKATADTNANKKSPPIASASNGAAIFPAAFEAMILSYPTKAAAPKPRKMVMI